jgi:hypothetical protein
MGKRRTWNNERRLDMNLIQQMTKNILQKIKERFSLLKVNFLLAFKIDIEVTNKKNENN